MIRYIMSLNLDMEARDRYGRTPLYAAKAKAMKVFLEHGASVNVYDKYRQTPFMLQADHGAAIYPYLNWNFCYNMEPTSMKCMESKRHWIFG